MNIFLGKPSANICVWLEKKYKRRKITSLERIDANAFDLQEKEILDALKDPTILENVTIGDIFDSFASIKQRFPIEMQLDEPTTLDGLDSKMGIYIQEKNKEIA